MSYSTSAVATSARGTSKEHKAPKKNKKEKKSAASSANDSKQGDAAVAAAAAAAASSTGTGTGGVLEPKSSSKKERKRGGKLSIYESIEQNPEAPISITQKGIDVLKIPEEVLRARLGLMHNMESNALNFPLLPVPDALARNSKIGEYTNILPYICTFYTGPLKLCEQGESTETARLFIPEGTVLEPNVNVITLVIARDQGKGVYNLSTSHPCKEVRELCAASFPDGNVNCIGRTSSLAVRSGHKIQTDDTEFDKKVTLIHTEDTAGLRAHLLQLIERTIIAKAKLLEASGGSIRKIMWAMAQMLPDDEDDDDDDEEGKGNSKSLYQETTSFILAPLTSNLAKPFMTSTGLEALYTVVASFKNVKLSDTSDLVLVHKIERDGQNKEERGHGVAAPVLSVPFPCNTGADAAKLTETCRRAWESSTASFKDMQEKMKEEEAAAAAAAAAKTAEGAKTTKAQLDSPKKTKPKTKTDTEMPDVDPFDDEDKQDTKVCCALFSCRITTNTHSSPSCTQEATKEAEGTSDDDYFADVMTEAVKKCDEGGLGVSDEDEAEVMAVAAVNKERIAEEVRAMKVEEIVEFCVSFLRDNIFDPVKGDVCAIDMRSTTNPSLIKFLAIFDIHGSRMSKLLTEYVTRYSGYAFSSSVVIPS